MKQCFIFKLRNQSFAPLFGDKNTNFKFQITTFGESIIIFINFNVLKGFFFDDKDNGLSQLLEI